MSDDDDLWRAVADTVRPLNSKEPPKKAKHVSLNKKLTLDVKPFRRTPDLDYSITSPLIEGDVKSMDKKTAERFKSGAMRIDAVLDLHGFTLDGAFEALKNFIYDQNKRGARCVLLVTGKGGMSGRGVLKEEVPNWMNKADIRSLILSYIPAKPKDGGGGAFYILLKRNRS